MEKCLIDIHSSILKFCDQFKLVGPYSDKISMTSVKQQRKQGEVTYRTSTKVLPTTRFHQVI